MKAEPKIALEEWLAEMQRLSARSDEGLTSIEWADEMGTCPDNALRRLRLAQDAGWLKVGRRRSKTLDGKAFLTPVYQIIKPKSGTKVPKGGAS